MRWIVLHDHGVQIIAGAAETADEQALESGVAPAAPTPIVRSLGWYPGYLHRLIVGDAAAIVVSSVLAEFVRFGDLDSPTSLWRPMLPFVMTVVWLSLLVVFRTYESRYLGLGSEEFQRVGRAATAAVAVVGTASWGLKLEVARGFVIIALPLAAVLTLALRYAARRLLHRRRERGEASQSVIIGGHASGVLATVKLIGRASYHGMRIAGVALPRGAISDDDASVAQELENRGIPVLGHLDEIAAIAVSHGIDAVAVLPTEQMDGPALRQLGWDLEAARIDLFVAPAVIEVVGPRIAIRPVCGLPLLHVHRPEFTGVRRVAKGVVDRVGAAVGLLVLAPLFAAIVVAIKLDSAGPAFFRQDRIGKDGTTFTLLKFRSMVTDAESLLSDLTASHDGNDVLFKMRADPRVTRVGRVLRHWSLDELPQLVNVLTGRMSLVGPRPPLAREVALYGDDAARRLLVKPGLTGLWQINGRSNLDWDESVRLDLRYVENWSFAYDFMILWKTLGAVVNGRGAY